MAMTNTSIKNLKARDKKYKAYDSGGLFLEVTTKGSKLWRFKFRYLGKEKLLSLGKYPDISLKSARAKRDELRTQVAEGIDPSAHRKATKIGSIPETSFTLYTGDIVYTFK